MDATINKNNKDDDNKDDDKTWPHRMLIIGPSRSGITNALLNLIEKQNNNNPIDKIYLNARDLNEPKYQFLIKNCKNPGITNYNDVHLLNTQPLWMMLITILMITIQKERYHF